MNHSRAQELLSDFLERDLGDAERAAFDAHLAGCDACSADLGGLRETVTLLRRMPAPEPPAFLATRVMARIAEGEARPVEAWRRWLAKLATPVVAASLAAAVGAVGVLSLAPSPRSADVVAEATPARDRTLVQRPVGDVPPSAFAAWAGAEPVVLAHTLRGAGHPHSRSLAMHFEGPTEAVVAYGHYR